MHVNILRVLILAYFCLHDVEAFYKVSVELQHKEVVFNEDVKLQCFVHGTQISNHSRQWWKGKYPNFVTVSANGYTDEQYKQHYSEYVQFENETDISLILEIHNFLESDLDTYKCIYGVKEDVVTLDLNENFIRIPQNYTITYLNTTTETHSLDIVLSMYKVYPKPDCWMSINNRTIQFGTPNIKSEEWFYTAEFQKQFLINHDECGEMVITACQIGSRRVELDQRKIAICQKEERWKLDKTSLGLGVACSVVVCVIIGIIFWYCWKKGYKMRKSQEDANEITMLDLTVCVDRAVHSDSLNSDVNEERNAALLQYQRKYINEREEKLLIL